MARGGKRQGAGRKQGSISRMAKQARAKAEATGQLPHEFLLAVVRGEKMGKWTPKPAQRIDAAKAAAPYFAPKMAAAELILKGNPFAQLFEFLEANRRRGLLPSPACQPTTPKPDEPGSS